MRILFLTGHFGVTSETFVYNRAVEWRNRGDIVKIVTYKQSNSKNFPYDDIDIFRKPNVVRRLWEKGLRRYREPTTIKHAAEYQKQLSQICSSFNPDMIHAEFGPMGVLATAVCLTHDIPLSVFMHAYDVTELPFSDSKWLDAYKTMFNAAEIIHTPSRFIRQKVIELGALEHIIKVTRNGIDVSKWRYADPALRFNKNRVEFLFVGRLVEKKGPLQLLQAFSKCRSLLGSSLDTQLTICGAGPLEQAIKKSIKDLGLAKNVKLVGKCTQEQVRQYMLQSHIMVQHSVTTRSGDMEGLPVSLTEAASTGLPIISTVHSGIPEIVLHNYNGYLVEENDIDGMAQHMCDLAKNRKLWTSFGLNGRKLVEKEFNHSDMTSK